MLDPDVSNTVTVLTLIMLGMWIFSLFPRFKSLKSALQELEDGTTVTKTFDDFIAVPFREHLEAFLQYEADIIPHRLMPLLLAEQKVVLTSGDPEFVFRVLSASTQVCKTKARVLFGVAKEDLTELLKEIATGGKLRSISQNEEGGATAGDVDSSGGTNGLGGQFSFSWGSYQILRKSGQTQSRSASMCIEENSGEQLSPIGSPRDPKRAMKKIMKVKTKDKLQKPMKRTASSGSFGNVHSYSQSHSSRSSTPAAGGSLGINPALRQSTESDLIEMRGLGSLATSVEVMGEEPDHEPIDDEEFHSAQSSADAEFTACSAVMKKAMKKAHGRKGEVEEDLDGTAVFQEDQRPQQKYNNNSLRRDEEIATPTATPSHQPQSQSHHHHHHHHHHQGHRRFSEVRDHLTQSVRKRSAVSEREESGQDREHPRQQQQQQEQQGEDGADFRSLAKERKDLKDEVFAHRVYEEQLLHMEYLHSDLDEQDTHHPMVIVLEGRIRGLKRDQRSLNHFNNKRQSRKRLDDPLSPPIGAAAGGVGTDINCSSEFDESYSEAEYSASEGWDGQSFQQQTIERKHGIEPWYTTAIRRRNSGKKTKKPMASSTSNPTTPTSPVSTASGSCSSGGAVTVVYVGTIVHIVEPENNASEENNRKFTSSGAAGGTGRKLILQMQPRYMCFGGRVHSVSEVYVVGDDGDNAKPLFGNLYEHSSSNKNESEDSDDKKKKKKTRRTSDAYGEQEDEDTDNSCIICYSADKDTVTIGCGHLAVCSACVRRVGVCPVCRQEITSVITIVK